MINLRNMTKDWTHILTRHRGMWLAFDEDEETVLAAAKSAKQALSNAVAKASRLHCCAALPDTLD
jgi:hypothetical protein